MKRIILAVGIATQVLILHARDGNTCELRKVFHHRIKHPKLENLELGNIVFYCDKYPQIEQKKSGQQPQGEKKQAQMRFYLSPVQVPASIASMIQEFNQVSPSSYTARLAVHPQQNQVELIISYDPSTIMISHDNFEAITQDKGVIIRLYNYTLLKVLEAKEKRLLKMSYAKPTIIIDCGHGGWDQGTIGVNQKSEKEVVLNIGKQLQQHLVHEGFKVCMIRSDDTFVPLDMRTTNANECQATSIFISLHANHSPKSCISGIETYCLAPNLFKGMGLETSLDILIEPLKDEHYATSEALAHSIHHEVLAQVRSVYPDVKDRKVQHKVAQVLVGTAMPSSLIELGFLSNGQEAHRLTSPAYQQLLVNGLVRGIKNFTATHA